ncbi:methyltransferase domain-containing protein [Alkalibaculum sp. M08DMB]|uniref:Methyltransferase domain-containing protein n=1 Tax=Alkalibaculum sporogenes TaxID=2655001 RepID=A0A6A7K5P6_9FIRM|nr:class I SAM-dependent methyltransferase [Alkalibaculum sporogenes]MPW24705.1 methyltransferase domain-containing protein [Alkalibaculum sporogenes]
MYNKMSRIYDELMTEEVDYINWTHYIQKIFARYNVEVKDVMDLGCGTGNITIPLSDMGYKMVGVDLSEDMLAIADSKAFLKNNNIKWIYGDMVDSQAYDMSYDAIISCCDAVNYILEEDELMKMFRNVYKGLKENGIFTFDINSYYKINQVYKDQVFTYTSDKINYIWENNYDEDTDIIEYYLNFFVKNDKDNDYTRSEEIHYQKAYKNENIIDMLLKVGFTSVELFKFDSFQMPDLEAERIQFCAIR